MGNDLNDSDSRSGQVVGGRRTLGLPELIITTTAHPRPSEEYLVGLRGTGTGYEVCKSCEVGKPSRNNHRPSSKSSSVGSRFHSLSLWIIFV